MPKRVYDHSANKEEGTEMAKQHALYSYRTTRVMIVSGRSLSVSGDGKESEEKASRMRF